MKLIVKIQSDPPCYLTGGSIGDPPRTLLKHMAKQFTSICSAKRAIGKSRRSHPFRERVYEIITF